MLIAIIAILILIMAQLTYLIFRNHHSVNEHNVAMDKMELEKTSANRSVAEPVNEYSSPLKNTSFEEALSLQPLFENLKKVTEENTRSLLQNNLNLMKVGVSAITYISERKTFMVTFSKQAMDQLKADKLEFMRSKDQIKAVLTYRGKVKELPELGSNARNLVSTATKLTTAVVSAANLISAADLAAKIDKISGKIDLVIELRKHDQLGRLESIYKHARELLALPPSTETEIALLSLSKDLHELRSGWRREINRKLLNIEDPENRTWFQKFITPQKSTDKNIVNEISNCEQDFRYIELSMLLQLLIFDSTGKADVFVRVSLPDELNQFETTLNLFEQKNQYMALTSSQASVAPTIKYFKQFIERYRTFQPVEYVSISDQEEV